jgi:hypothetical protein
MRGIRKGLRSLTAGLIAGVCSVTGRAHATDGQWLLAPQNSDWNNWANWTSAPLVPDQTAEFGLSGVNSITFSLNTSIQALNFFLGGGPTYSFALSSSILTIGGTASNQGIINNVLSPETSNLPQPEGHQVGIPPG